MAASGVENLSDFDRKNENNVDSVNQNKTLNEEKNQTNDFLEYDVTYPSHKEGESTISGPQLEALQGIEVGEGDIEGGSGDYVPPCEDPHDKAWKYLAKHNILHLFQGLTANVFYKRPPDPLQSMIDQIQKLQQEDRQRKGVIKPLESPDSPVI